MFIYLKSIDESVHNMLRLVRKFEVNFTTDPRDAVLYTLKNYYSKDVKIGDIIIEKTTNKNTHNFDLFCTTTVQYKTFQYEKSEILTINNDGETVVDGYYNKPAYKTKSEKIRIEIKLDKKKHKQKPFIQKFKNIMFKLNILISY